MVFVKGDTFIMGSMVKADKAKPLHRVTVGSFYISRYEITVAEFNEFVMETRYKTTAEQTGWARTGATKRNNKHNQVHWRYDAKGMPRNDSLANHPVIFISYADANAYCQWLTRKTGRTWRLPTEAEWEYAAGGGKPHHSFDYSGSNRLSGVGWVMDAEGHDHAVGLKQPNELGLYDMTGNVWEWCQDYYHKDFYANGPLNNPCDTAKAGYAVMRGGSYRYTKKASHITYRNYDKVNTASAFTGFRVVATD